MTTNDYGKVLGKVESQIMEIVWQANKPISVAEVVSALSKKRKVAHTTVMTIMGRLVEKGLLKRIPSGKTHFFKPAYSQDVFLSRMSRKIIKNFVSTFGDKAVAYFSEELEKIPSEKKQRMLQTLKEAKKNDRK